MKQTSIGSLSMGIDQEDKNRKVLIERTTYNMGKRRERFSIEVKNRFTSAKIQNLTLEELEQIVELAKELKAHMEENN